MNCKPGDLAVVVRSNAGNEGRVVTCIRYVGEIPGWLRNDYWETDSLFPSNHGCIVNIMSDSYLRPIRPDETPEESIAAMDKLIKEKDHA